MNKKHQISYLRKKIMYDINDINILLDLITSYKVETFTEIMVIINIALEKGKRINKNNQKIGRILGC